ncbi:MAG: glycosyltransferase family 39 protein [Elusimicrobiota bacterium]
MDFILTFSRLFTILKLMKKNALLILFIILLAVSTIIKLQFILLSSGTGLSGDAGGFLDYSVQMRNFYEASPREPLWILVTRISSSLTADPKTGMRLTALFFSILSAIVMYMFIKRNIGPLPAFAGTVFYIFIPYMFYSPVRAHRLEIYLFMLLFFTHMVFFLKTSYSSAVTLGIFSGLLFLLRFESIIIAVTGIICFIKRDGHRSAYRHLLLFLTVTATIAGPFYFNCYKDKGSFFYVINRHARFYAQHEKAVVLKTITEEESLLRPYEDTNMNLFSYIFGMHSIPVIVKRIILGYYEVLTKASKHLLSTPVDLVFLIYPVWIGLPVLLASSKGRQLFFWGALYILPYSFILSTRVAGRSSVDIRFGATAAPLMAFGLAGFCLGMEWAARYIEKQEGSCTS